MTRPPELNLTHTAGLAKLRGSKDRSLSMANCESTITGMLCLGMAHLYYLSINGELRHYRYKWM